MSDNVLVWLSVWSEVQIVCNIYGPADATAVPQILFVMVVLIQYRQWRTKRHQSVTGYWLLPNGIQGSSRPSTVKENWT